MDGGPTVDLTTSLKIDHDGQSIEVAGYLTISDRAVAESLAHVILAPFINR